MRPMKRISALFLLLALLPLAACSAAEEAPQPAEPKGMVYYTYFDTVSYVYDYTGDSAERFEDRSAEVSSILLKYHQLTAAS